MKIKALFILVTLLTILSVWAWLPSKSQAVGKPDRAVKAAAAEGLVQIDGEPVVVTVWVAVEPGEDPPGKAKAALKRAYPEVQELEHADYTTTGLVWDQFKDGDPTNNKVEVHYNPNGAPTSSYRNSWLAAMNTWTNEPSSSFVYEPGSDTTRCPSLVKECPGSQYFDGNNDVGWLNIADPSVLGVTWYSTSRDEFDMALDNQDFNWYAGDGSVPQGYYDSQTVWLHEHGHGLGLGHSTVDGAVMEPYYEGPRRTLHWDDINGVSYLYPASGSPVTPTPTLTPTPTPTPGCWPRGKCKK